MGRRILVCGGAGYIGSHMVKLLLEEGEEVTVLDDLSTGKREAVGDRELVVGDVRDGVELDRLFGRRRFDAVMHFCARSLVGESVRQPVDYYANNVAGTVTLLEAMLRHGVDRIVFSSSAAVFGHPVEERITEDHPKDPVNPYGESKRMVETILADAARAHGLRSVSLRYFNAAGASPDGDIGESHDPETHLIPNVLLAALGERDGVTVFGSDYPTRDGTCIRDYVHVDDLARAHMAALAFMDDRPGAHFFNLGNGQGFSVLEVIEAARAVTGRAIHHGFAGRREGDPATLVASSDRARELLGWAPEISGLEEIIDSAWRWHRAPRY